MRIDTKDPRELWQLYEEGRGYKSYIHLFRTVDINERFYAGEQWYGLNAPDIDKPIANIIRQPVNYMAATIAQGGIAIDIAPSLPSAEDERFLDSVKAEVERVLEQCDGDTLNREAIRNAAVDGDACVYLYWDSTVKTGQQADGDIRMQTVENTRVIFGNPTCHDPQRQPYIQIVMRDYIEDVIDEAVANGMSESRARDEIRADGDYDGSNSGFDKLVTKLLTFYRKDGTIHAVISTERTIIREEWDTELTLYPIAWFSWQRSRSSYHGVSIVTELVPTQIAVNKMLAAYLRCTMLYAWPKVIYNAAIFPHGWDNRIGANIKVNGNPNDAYAAMLPGTGATMDVTNALDWIMARAKEASGANDASLGQINSDNTSAIIAAQEANTIPLDVVQRSFYAFFEQIIRIVIDMLAAYAGVRYVPLTDDEIAQQQAQQMPMTDTYGDIGGDYYAEDGGEMMTAAPQMPDKLYSPVLDSAASIGTPMDIANAPDQTKVVDFSRLRDMAWNLTVSVGTGSYFSEAIRNTTLSNLLQMGVIDELQYFERVDDKFVPNKQGIIDALKEQQAAMPPDMGGGAVVPEAGDPDAIADPGSVQAAKNYIQGLRPMA